MQLGSCCCMPAVPSRWPPPRAESPATNRPTSLSRSIPAVQRYHSSSNYVRRVAEDVVFDSDPTFRYTRAMPTPITSSGSRARLTLHAVTAAAAAALWGLLA